MNGLTTLFGNAETIDGLLLVLLAGIENDGREVGTVGRVGEMLALKAYCRATWEHRTVPTLIVIAEVVGVNLHSWLGGEHFQGSAALRFRQSGGKAQLALFALVKHKAVVVALSVLDLLVVGINVLTDGLRRAEVERRISNLQDFARGNAGSIDGQCLSARRMRGA